MLAGIQSMKTGFVESATGTLGEYEELYREVKHECTPTFKPLSYYTSIIYRRAHEWVHIPYFPPFHRPGWLVRYVVGPFDSVWIENLIADISAGITVALTLIPQALSYAALANLPPVQGLYSAILPSACYCLLGTSMQLAVGPVAIVSLLTGTLVAKWQPDYATNLQGATDTAAQAALCTGIILLGMGLLNLGSFIHFISHPVMSGFTTGAAMSIGLSQMKNAFGFLPPKPIVVPQQGMAGFELNYNVMDWYAHNWNGVITTAQLPSAAGRYYTNHFAIAICFGLFVPLMVISILKQSIKATPERKKKLSFKIWNICASLTPFAAIIIGAHVAWQIKSSPDQSYYAKNLKIVGFVTPGLDIIRAPNLLHPFGEFFVDCIPITLVLFMESYSVARRIASSNNELHILNASQELVANGVANLLGCISSAYPVSGSFSRSSLNQACGAKTPLSKITTLCVVLIALSTLTQTFNYIPQAALAAVIMMSISTLISFSDLWESWKHAKKDFVVMLVTLSVTFICETSIGLAVGIGCSVLFYLADLAFSDKTKPFLVSFDREASGINVVKLQGDFTFVQSAKIKDYITDLHLTAAARPDAATTRSERLFLTVTTAFDTVLNPHLMSGVENMPLAIVMDLSNVRLIDITGLISLNEIFYDARRKNILMLAICATEEVASSIAKFGISNDPAGDVCGLEKYSELGGIIPITVRAVRARGEIEVGVELVEVEEKDDEGNIKMIKDFDENV